MNIDKAIGLLDNRISMVENNNESDYDIALRMARNALKTFKVLVSIAERIMKLKGILKKEMFATIRKMQQSVMVTVLC